MSDINKELSEKIESICRPIFEEVLKEKISSGMTITKKPFRFAWRPNNYRRQIKVKRKDIIVVNKIRSAIDSTTEGQKVTVSQSGSLRRKARKVMEKYLGRKLKKDEIVHHKDGDLNNYSLRNLDLMDISSHVKSHQKSKIRSNIIKTTIGKPILNYSKHTRIISIKNYKPNITIQYAKDTLTSIWSQNIINGKKQFYSIEGKNVLETHNKIDAKKKEIEKLMDQALKEFSERFKIKLKFEKPIHVRSEDCLKGDEFLDSLPRDLIIHDTYFKKVYSDETEFISKKGQTHSVTHVKNYIKNRAIEDISPRISEQLILLNTKFDLYSGLTDRFATQLDLHLNAVNGINNSFKRFNKLLSGKKTKRLFKKPKPNQLKLKDF